MGIVNKLAYAVSGRNRKRKFRFFMGHFKPGPETRVLDVGASNEEYSETDNYLEKHYPFPKNITSLSVKKNDELIKNYPKIKAVLYEGSRFPFNDKMFHICWSNAVIEHVGGYTKQLEFLREVRRVSKMAFLTTPNRYFPIEVHTRIPLLHLLPKKLFDKVLCLIGKRWASGDYMNLLSRSKIRSLLKDAGIEQYSIRANRFLGFVMDFMIILE